MELPDHDPCYRALQSRDARFDDLLFLGISCTRIYCRAVCLARTPTPASCQFFSSAAAAQEAGFRPCLRCRPETAPNLASRRGTSNTVSRALALITEGALDRSHNGVETLACGLRIGDWTAQYISVRAVREIDFPATDVALLRGPASLHPQPHSRKAPQPRRILELLASYAAKTSGPRPRTPPRPVHLADKELPMSLATKITNSPVGPLKLVASAEGLVAILWHNEKPNRVRLGPIAEDPAHPILLEAERQLHEYFAGNRQSFTVPLEMRGTQFQQNVWRALLGIPFGETRSYGQLALELGTPKAMRAVGAASGRNPLSIVVPCHRVVGASGKLTGFAGGLETKAHLLAHESRPTDPNQ